MLVRLCISFAAVLVSAPSIAQSFQRMEVRTLESMTLSGEQFLTGDTAGKRVTLAGELRIPRLGNDRLPAVILVHGSGGVNVSHDRWAQDINSIGVATFIVDTFSGRGIVNTILDQSQLHSLAMMLDAYRALGELARHPRIDPERIAVMGFSKGAVAAVYSSSERFAKLYAPSGARFAAHIGMYTPCNVRYRDEEKTTGKPVRLHHGIPDDWVSIGPCRDLVARLKTAGGNAALAEYEGAYHAYDAFQLKAPIKFAQAQTTRNCVMEEGANGVVLNSKTGKPYELNDPCVERGTQVAYNAAAHEATVKAVKEFLMATFRIPAP
jgi:dienelactone hydrolase